MKILDFDFTHFEKAFSKSKLICGYPHVTNAFGKVHDIKELSL